MSAASAAAVLMLGARAAAAEPTKDQCIDANESAQTLVRAAKLLEAKRKLLVCVAASCPGPVREDCAQRLTQVEPQIPTLVFEAKDEHDRDLSAVRVTMDSQPLVDTLDGTAIPLDPGEHHFVFQAEGRRDETRTLVLHEGDKNRHERFVLSAAAAAVADTARETGVQSGRKPAVSDGQTERTIGLALGGTGAATVVVGAVFGILAKVTYDDALKNKCNAKPNDCSDDGLSERRSADNQATVSTVAFVAGPALLAAGAYFYFFASKSGSVSVAPTVGTAGAGLSMRGRW